MKYLTLIILFASCNSVVQLHHDKWVNHKNMTFYFITVNHEFIDTTATFNYQEAERDYKELKRAYKSK